jgi:hypothetical protein
MVFLYFNFQVALLFFLGQEGFHEYGSDYVAISYVKGHVLFTWDLGAGESYSMVYLVHNSWPEPRSFDREAAAKNIESPLSIIILAVFAYILLESTYWGFFIMLIFVKFCHDE